MLVVFGVCQTADHCSSPSVGYFEWAEALREILVKAIECHRVIYFQDFCLSFNRLRLQNFLALKMIKMGRFLFCP